MLVNNNNQCNPCGITPIAGLQSPRGLRGLQGIQGPQGLPGLPGAGAIIPYASGTPAVLTTVLGGLLGTASLVGFGSSATGVSIAGGVIDLTGAGGTLLNMAFSVPRPGFITSLSAYFSTTAAVDLLGSTVTIIAQLYRSFPAPLSNFFAPIPGASVILAPPLTGLVALGTVSQGNTSGLAIPVAQGERLLLAFFALETGGVPIASIIAGYASAGVAIS